MGAGLNRQLLDATTKTGSVELLNGVQGFPVDANRNNGIGSAMVRRFNRATVRWPNPWPFPSIAFEVQTTANANADMRIPVFQGGVQIGVVTPATAQARQSYTFPVTPTSVFSAAGQIDAWEGWNTKDGSQNQGADGSVASSYITAAYMPPGYAIQAGGVAVGVEVPIVCGESIVGAVLPFSATFGNNEVFGVAGQLRLAAQAMGKLLVSLDYGGATLRGDGISPAQFAAWIIQGIQSVKATRAVVHFNITRNDWVNWGSTVQSSPTQCATDLQTIMNTVTASALALGILVRFVVATPIPQTVETANGGGFTLGAYRTALQTLVTPPNASAPLQIIDSTTMGIIVGSGAGPAVDLGDNVHMNQFGVAKYYAKVKVPILGS